MDFFRWSTSFPARKNIAPMNSLAWWRGRRASKACAKSTAGAWPGCLTGTQKSCPYWSVELQFLKFINPKLEENTLRRVGWDVLGTMVTIPTRKTAVVAYASFLQGVTAEALPEVIPRLSEIGRQIRDPSRHAADTETTHGTGWQTPGFGASPNPAGEKSRATRNSAGPVLLPSWERENQCLRTYGRANRRQTKRRCLGLALQRTRHQRRPAGALQRKQTTYRVIELRCLPIWEKIQKQNGRPRFEAGRPFCILVKCG